MIRSFQMKLALLSTLISAVVLTVFSLVFWHFVVESQQQRLDRDLASLAHQLLAPGAHSIDDLHIGDEQVAIFGEELRGYATLLTDIHQQVIQQSDNWPQAVTASVLPAATELDQTRLPSHEHDAHGQHDEHRMQDDHHGGILVAPQFKTVEKKGRHWRLVGLHSAGHTLHVALDLATFKSNRDHLRGFLILAVGTALLVSALGAWWIARRALRPVRNLTLMAETVTASKLGQRLEQDDADREFARLIRVFNEMLKRLDDSFGQAVRFSADASHELKTPLTIMQGEVETALQKAPAGSEMQLALASQLEEIQRLSNLVGKLLLLSNADSGALRPARKRFDFSELVQRVCEDIPALNSSLRVDCDIDQEIELEGDQDLLRQVVQNLVVNAVSYNQPDGWVRCELKKSPETALLRISNSAERISVDQFEKIFRRFYRLDDSRTGQHSGLGLSLAREIARVHGGELQLMTSDRTGTVFELELPARI